MGSLLTRIGTTYYLKKVEQTSTVLTYKRTPSWRSLVLFIGESSPGDEKKFLITTFLPFIQLSTASFCTYLVNHVSGEEFTVFCTVHGMIVHACWNSESIDILRHFQQLH